MDAKSRVIVIDLMGDGEPVKKEAESCERTGRASGKKRAYRDEEPALMQVMYSEPGYTGKRGSLYGLMGRVSGEIKSLQKARKWPGIKR